MQKYEENLAARINGNNLQPLAEASITVTDNATGLPAALYQADELTLIPQPLVTDESGFFGFKAANGEYTLTISGSRFATFTRQITLIDPDQIAGSADNLHFIAAGTGAVSRNVADRIKETVSVKDFGAVGDGSANDTAAVLAAIAYIKTLTYKPTLFFPAGAYRMTTPLPIYTGLSMMGAGRTDEYGKGTLLFNNDTDLFSYDEQVIGLKWIGITFRGNLACTTKFINNNTDPTHSIYWSKIYDCGFNYFNKTTMTLTGVHITGCFFNNSLYGGFEFKGADNDIVRNFFGSATTAAATLSTVYLSTYSNSRFTRNYITGWKTIPLTMTSCNETNVDGCWIDESDLSGIYMVGCKGIVVTGTRFKNLLRVPAGVHAAGLTIFDSSQIKATNCTFAGISASLYMIAARVASGATDAIQCIGNTSFDGVTTKYLLDDASTNIEIRDPAIPLRATINGTVSPRREDGIRGRAYFNTAAATVNSFLLLPKALPGMEFTAIRGSATYYIRIDPQATEKFRGLAAGVTRTLATEGASLRFQCVEAGVWDVVGSSGTIS